MLHTRTATFDEMFPQGQDRSTGQGENVDFYETWGTTILHEITHA
jgi:hypothetical protein